MPAAPASDASAVVPRLANAMPQRVPFWGPVAPRRVTRKQRQPVTRLVLILALAAGVACSTAAATRTTAASDPSCPGRLPTSEPSARPGSSQKLVPPGASSLLLCSYHGLNPAALARTLERSGHLDRGSLLTAIVAEFDALPASLGMTGCPMDDGSAILAVFSYAGPPTSPVTVGLTGCRIVGNGHITRTASLPPGPMLIAQLTAILG